MVTVFKKTSGVVLGAFGLIAASITVVSFAVPESRDWLGSNPLVGWVVCVLLAGWGFAATGFALHYKDVGDDGKEALAIAENETARVHADLAAALAQPTEADQARFVGVLNHMQRLGIIDFISHKFFGKQWTVTDSDNISTFHTTWRNQHFDQPDVQDAFLALLSTVDDLSQWMSANGHISDKPERDGSLIARVPTGDDRPGGWSEYQSLREKGEILAGKVPEARVKFECVGRSHHLTPPPPPPP